MIPGTFITTMNAQDIANIIQQFYSEQDGKSWFELGYSSPGGPEMTKWVHPLSRDHPIKLANGDQLIRCESRDGYQVDIIVPREDREYTPATVIVAKHPGAR